MKYIEITITTNTFGSELIADILHEQGSNGVTIYDSADIAILIKSDVIWDYIEESLLEKNEIVTVKGFYEVKNFDTIYHEILQGIDVLRSNSDVNLGGLEVSISEIDDSEWKDVWKKYYKPIHIGKLVIVPMWLKYDKLPSEKVVLMNPGMAFGTGEHESTQLCLGLLEELNVAGKEVLDIGTGSGILGIAAAKLGAKSVYMSDIDEIAVKSAKENSALNELQHFVRVEKADLLQSADISGDIVIANITADILIAFSKDIVRVTRTNGYVILSGIIKARLLDVKNAYLQVGLQLDKEIISGEWCGLRFHN